MFLFSMGSYGSAPDESIYHFSHDRICRRSLKIQSRSLKLYFRTSRSSPYNFPFESLKEKKEKEPEMLI